MRHYGSTRVGTAFAIVCALAVPGTFAAPAARSAGDVRTLLAVFAHPDDEQVVSPMLARYAREGVRVLVAYATGGQKGVREHAGIPEGEALAAARAEEARCACARLGVGAPILLGLQDGELYKGANQAALIEELTRLLDELEPDAIVTWGPDGVTGHPDHRMVSSIVSQLVQQRDPDGAELFYVGLPAERLSALEGLPETSGGGGVPLEVAVVRTRYLPVRVAYSEADARAAREALGCHRSQYTPEEVALMDAMARALEGGAVHLRPWFVATGTADGVFP